MPLEFYPSSGTPTGLIPLPQETIDLIALWIDLGAMNDDNGFECPPEYTFNCNNECVLEGLLSDLNSDTNIDILDILVLVNCVIDGDCDSCSDLNEDGNNDILDIITLIQIILN